MPGSGSNPRPVFQDPGVREGRRPARNAVTEMGLKRGGPGLQPPSSGLGSRPRGLQARAATEGRPADAADAVQSHRLICSPREHAGAVTATGTLDQHQPWRHTGPPQAKRGPSPPPPRPNGTLAFPHPSAPAAIRRLRPPPPQPTPHVPEIKRSAPPNGPSLEPGPVFLEGSSA